MKSELFAQISIPTTIEGKNGKYQRSIGTAYPIADGLVLTARHVLFPEFKDESKPMEVIWHDYQNFRSEFTDIIFDGGEKLDIAVIACKTPPKVNTLLTFHDPRAGEEWDSFGYPKAGKNEVNGTREKIPGKGTFFEPNSNSYLIHLTSEGDAATKSLWKGMSGASVFGRHSHTLLAVITSTPKEFNERLHAISIPRLLKDHQEFKEKFGYLIQKKPKQDYKYDVLFSYVGLEEYDSVKFARYKFAKWLKGKLQGEGYIIKIGYIEHDEENFDLNDSYFYMKELNYSRCVIPFWMPSYLNISWSSYEYAVLMKRTQDNPENYIIPVILMNTPLEHTYYNFIEQLNEHLNGQFLDARGFQEHETMRELLDNNQVFKKKIDDFIQKIIQAIESAPPYDENVFKQVDYKEIHRTHPPYQRNGKRPSNA